MEVKALIENLTDCGCSAEGTRRAKALYEAGDMDGLVKYLRKCRCDLVDYLIRQTQKEADKQ